MNLPGSILFQSVLEVVAGRCVLLTVRDEDTAGSYKAAFYLKAGFHLNECNDSAEAACVGACVVGSNVDSPAAALGRIG